MLLGRPQENSFRGIIFHLSAILNYEPEHELFSHLFEPHFNSVTIELSKKNIRFKSGVPFMGHRQTE